MGYVDVVIIRVDHGNGPVVVGPNPPVGAPNIILLYLLLMCRFDKIATIKDWLTKLTRLDDKINQIG